MKRPTLLRSSPLPRLLLALTLLLTSATASRAQAVYPGYLPDDLRGVLRPPPTYVDARVLSANTAETVTVPTFTDTRPLVGVVFSADCASFYVNSSATAAVPAADVTNGSASERNPAGYQYPQGDQFSIIAPTDCKITMAWYYGNR